jgi:hypothetical protein
MPGRRRNLGATAVRTAAFLKSFNSMALCRNPGEEPRRMRATRAFGGSVRGIPVLRALPLISWVLMSMAIGTISVHSIICSTQRRRSLWGSWSRMGETQNPRE